MNIMSRIITGIVVILLGAYGMFISFLELSKDWPGFVWGIIFVVIGFFILFNKKEDDIEEIKNNKLNNKK